MKKLFFVYNPYSGRAYIKNCLSDIVNIFTVAGYEVTVYPTQRVLDGYEKVCEADGKYDLIVCSGGDGTLNEVIGAAMTHQITRPRIGYIPSGSTNDFASGLGIPKDMKKAARNIADGEVFSCDIGLMNGRYFNYVAAFGVFTEVSYKTPQNMKNILGHQAYVLESIKSLSKIQAYDMKIQFDTVVREERYIFGMVANSESVGGIKGIIGSDVEMNDGMFEVALVKEPKNPIELQQVIGGLLNKNSDNPMVERFKTSEIVFESSEMVAWTLDGEDGGEHTNVDIQVLNKAVDIIIPKSAPPLLTDSSL